MTAQNLSAPLPITFIDIRVKKSGSSYDLHWSTTKEINCDYMSVERSHDARSWVEIGTVPNEKEPMDIHHYKFTDADLPKKGVYYYRIRQVDYDGRYRYSDLVYVAFGYDGIESGFRLYYAAEEHSLRIISDGDYSPDRKNVMVYNNVGQKVYQRDVQNGESLIDVSHLDVHQVYTAVLNDHSSNLLGKVRFLKL